MQEGQQLFSPPITLPVISVGRDRPLLTTRQKAMEGEGILVRSLPPEQVEAMAHDGNARVWVFCGSIDLPTLVYLAGSVRRHSPESRLLLVEWNESAGIEVCLFHRVLDGHVPAETLAAVVREMDDAI